MKRCVLILILFLLVVPTVRADEPVPEGSTSWWVVDFVDQNNVPVVPETATYRAQTIGDKEHAGVELIATTPAPTPLATTITIQAPQMVVPNLNTRNPDLPDPVASVFTVRFCWAAGAKCRNAEKAFALHNAPGWP